MAEQLRKPSAARSRNMAAVRRTDTTLELRTRSALHRLGLRFRKDFPVRVAGRLIRPDIAFTKLHVAVFVDGCFWHGCPEHGTMPTTNADFWRNKLETNASRDRLQTKLLIDAGWLVIRIWEHEATEEAVAVIQRAVSERHRTNVI
ncbi:very short patch repair endonuclease [Mycolicibacterium lutetiense]